MIGCTSTVVCRILVGMFLFFVLGLDFRGMDGMRMGDVSVYSVC